MTMADDARATFTTYTMKCENVKMQLELYSHC